MNKELEAILKSVILVQQLVVLPLQFTHQWWQLQAFQQLAELWFVDQAVNVLKSLLLEKSSWPQALPSFHNCLELVTLTKGQSIWLYFSSTPLNQDELLHLMEVVLRQELFVYILPVLLKQDQDFLLLKDSQLKPIHHDLLPKSRADIEENIVLQALNLIQWLVFILIGSYCLFDSSPTKSSPLSQPFLHMS